ncbi:AAA family ATPase [Geotalea uraniireducens]|uniref:SMC domain protein n=1 Tax=Geotalea uraniireducens (strain Rf4) TaxID=351605 RepID=A5G4E0_GEOUR|nr:AAA family ATPase [Geotalea uraniireducens]ABQ26658.1 SMC domain protein [Geotalea uraniireducens Rf4]
MILERLILENFRQFKGRQELVFSDLRERNVTVVHAENGFGKTTLLKALVWCFYGRDGLMGIDGNPDDFERPDRIIHEGLALRAKDPLALTASVQITFKHDADRYVLTRQLSLAQQNLNPRQTTLSLEVMRNGQTFSLDRPQQRIQALIPDGISRFLFFNGERINYLAMERNSSQVTDAIHQMLGLDLLKITIDDLRHQNVRGKLRTEQKETTSEEKRELIEQLSRQEELIKEYIGQQDQTLANLKAINAELASVNDKLAANRVAHELQSKRIHLTREREELAGKRDEVTKRLSKLISDDGYTLLTSKLINRGCEIIAQLRSEGKIPARVLNTFLQELLEHSKCICTRSLAEGSPERAAVENLLTIAGDQDFNNAVGALDHAIGVIEGVGGQTQELLNQLKLERLELSRDIRERDEELEEIHQALGGKKDEEVNQLEEKFKSLHLDRDGQNAALGRIDGQIKAATVEIETLEAQIRQIADKEEAAARAQRRVDAVEDCINILTQILKAETEDLRPLLNAEIDSHFRKIMTKDYWAELTDNFTLRIRKRVAGGDGGADPVEIDAALSTGERTVTSLVFIASLVALAKRRSEIPTILRDLAGSTFPIAIDSPFGSLSIFREGVAKYIPELAPQVVLFVSPKQYDGEVEAVLSSSGRIGKRYYLTYYGPTMPEKAAPELIVEGQKIQQYFPLETDEYTEIVPL